MSYFKLIFLIILSKFKLNLIQWTVKYQIYLIYIKLK